MRLLYGYDSSGRQPWQTGSLSFHLTQTGSPYEEVPNVCSLDVVVYVGDDCCKESGSNEPACRRQE